MSTWFITRIWQHQLTRDPSAYTRVTMQAAGDSSFATFTKWAKTQRQIFVCNGIAPGRMRNGEEGSGIYAKRTIKVCAVCAALYTWFFLWGHVTLYFLTLFVTVFFLFPCFFFEEICWLKEIDSQNLYESLPVSSQASVICIQAYFSVLLSVLYCVLLVFIVFGNMCST